MIATFKGGFLPFRRKRIESPPSKIGGFRLKAAWLIAWLLFSGAAFAGEIRTATDSAGREVLIPTPVRRIVALSTDSLEVVRILNAQDLVVGVNETVPKEPLFWPEFQSATVVGHPFNPNLEQIAAIRPDLVLAYLRRPGPELERKLEPSGIRVLRLDFFRMSTIAEEVRTLGRLLEKETEAEAYVGWLHRHMSNIDEIVARAASRPRVYVEGYTAFRASGPGSSGFELCRMAGGTNIAADLAVHAPLITSEWVTAQNPDAIVKLSSLRDEYLADSPLRMAAFRQEIMDRNGWGFVDAVKNGRVFALSGDVGPGPRGIVGIAYMVKWFFPQSAKDLKPREMHKEYLETFQGVPYRGHYAYPDD